MVEYIVTFAALLASIFALRYFTAAAGKSVERTSVLVSSDYP